MDFFNLVAFVYPCIIIILHTVERLINQLSLKNTNCQGVAAAIHLFSRYVLPLLLILFVTGFLCHGNNMSLLVAESYANESRTFVD